ncbi:MAG: DUF4150 domain-containing protein, partial [Acidobacteria bacterium]|nr:DUF4150 domain-containing protein [Acidobacteriota bacterium]
DVCKTPAPPAPPIPLPYPNLAMMNQAIPPTCSLKVLVVNKPTVHKMTTIAMSSGDEPGAALGVKSSMIKGPAKFVTASKKVFVEGKPMVFLSCDTRQNGDNANTVGKVVAPSQSKVFVKS